MASLSKSNTPALNIDSYSVKPLINGLYKNRYLYLMLIPGIIWVVLFKYWPIYGVSIAFKDFQIFKGIGESPWVGFEQFQRLFADRNFSPVFRNTILISLYKIVWGFPAPIIIALMLNELRSKMVKRSIQTIIYFPHFFSWVIVGGLMFTLLSPDGLVNSFLKHFGADRIIWLAEEKYFRGILVVSDIWKEAGWGTVMYLAALAGIDTQLYEAAIVDGANRFQRLKHVTIPGIIPTIVIMLILKTGHIMEAGFEQTLLLLNANVRGVGEIIDTYVYRMGMEQKEYSFSAAVGLFKSVINLVFILSTNFLVKKLGHDSLF